MVQEGITPKTPERCAAAVCRVSGQALWERMQNSFGYLTSGQGYQGHVFPVVFGESGSMYLTVRGVPSPLTLWSNSSACLRCTHQR